jgi:molybdopterin-guanine dinucleotide biosynthesis protein A
VTPKPEPIGPVLHPRHARTRRASERWLDANPCDVPLDTEGEVERVCASAARTWAHDKEQAEAERAVASARAEADEQERLAYLARRRADLLATRDSTPPPSSSATASRGTDRGRR